MTTIATAINYYQKVDCLSLNFNFNIIVIFIIVLNGLLS